MSTLIAGLVLAAVLAPLIQRDCQRAVERRRLAECRRTYEEMLARRERLMVSVSISAQSLAFAEQMQKAAAATRVTARELHRYREIWNRRNT